MKKIVLCLILFLIPCLSTFADWTTVLSFGGAIPVMKAEVELDNTDDEISAAGFDGYIDCMLINNNNRLSFFAFEAIGGISTDDIYDDDTTGLHIAGMLGLGFAPVNSEKAVLALHGVIGYNYFFFSDDVIVNGYSVDTNVSGIFFAVGVNMSGAFHFTDRFGMNIGVAVLAGLGGSCEVEAKRAGIKVSEDYDIESGSLSVLPRIGFSLFF